eukprot:3645185-Rhodomonas_salina.1
MREVIGELQWREQAVRVGRGKAVMAMAEGARLAGELAVENARLREGACSLRDAALHFACAVSEGLEQDREGTAERLRGVVAWLEEERERERRGDEEAEERMEERVEVV